MNTSNQILKNKQTNGNLKRILLDTLPAQLNASQFKNIESIPSIFTDSLTNTPASAANSANSLMANFFRKKMITLLSQLQQGSITLIDPVGELHLGEKGTGLHCRIQLANINVYTAIALSGSNGAAQAYIDGVWTIDNLTDLMRIFIRNQHVLKQIESGTANVAQFLYRCWHANNKNTKQGSRRNIAAHYDLGNDFFRLFLDEKMMYSSALYCNGDDLQQASDRKLQRICDTLELNQDDHVIEIGSGWGGFACYAAQRTGCKVTTVTISQEQFNEANKKINAYGLDHLVTLKLQDYRDVKGQYDKLVSIEMIEAIGHQYLDTYFNKLNELLKPQGKALIQAIVIDDAHYKSALKTVDYIKRYIFPGGFMPSYSVMSQFAAQNRLMLEDLHDMGLSYAQTLRDWRKRFYENIEHVQQQGYDRSFQRMWEYYLCYCEGGFDERAISVGQLLFRKQANV